MVEDRLEGERPSSKFAMKPALLDCNNTVTKASLGRVFCLTHTHTKESCHGVLEERRHPCNKKHHLGIFPNFNHKPSMCKSNFPILPNHLNPEDSSLFLLLETKNRIYSVPQ